MLVLSRKVGESIVIGDAILTVLSVKAGQLRLGVQAPPDVRILRAELLDGVAPRRAGSRPGQGPRPCHTLIVEAPED